MIDTIKSESPIHIKEDILSDDDWQYNMTEVSPKKMKRLENSTEKIEPSPNQSSNSKKKKKKKKDRSRKDRKEEEPQESNTAGYSQDIIESSQPPVTLKKEINEPESPIQLRDETSRKKKAKKKKRMSFIADDENRSDPDTYVIENENPNHQNRNHEFNQPSLDVPREKSKSKVKRKSSWDESSTDICSPVKKKREKDPKTSNKKIKLEETVEPIKLSPSVVVEDSDTEPELSKRDKKHEAQVKVRRKKLSNTLLAMMNNSTSSSDSDEKTEEIIDVKTEPVTPRKDKKPEVKQKIKTEPNTLLAVMQDNTDSSDSDNGPQVFRPHRSRGIIEDDDSSDGEIVEKPIAKRVKGEKFDLEEEAKDVAESIIALEADEQVPKQTVRKLHSIRITFRHTVPPQHQVETCAGSRGPTKEQREMMEKFGPIKKGSFTPEEDSIIVNNWKAFCKMHDWDVRDVQPFLYMRHQHVGFVTKFSERVKFVQFLADGLPWRTLYSVYWRFRNLYRPHRQSRYTQDEDTLIIAHMENSTAINEKNVRKFSELAKLLNRTRASVWRRYRILKKNRDVQTKTDWNLHVVKKMIKNLLKLTLNENVSQLKDLDIPCVVWKKLSSIMRIDAKTLKEFWQHKLHMQLFCEEPVYLNDVKIKLIEYFYVTGISEWWEINWPNIAKQFDGMTSLFLSQLFSRLTYNEKFEGKELPEIVEYLYNVKKPELQRCRMDKTLPRIVYENGSVKLIPIEASDQPNKKKKKKFEDSSV